MLSLIFIALVLFVCFTLVRSFYLIFMNDSPSKKKQCKTMIIFGSGGHTSEMLTLSKSLTDKYNPRIYVYAETDHGSVKKIKSMELEKENSNKFSLESIPRSREVKQPWVSTIFTTLNACFRAVAIVWRHKPDLILCNGPGTCIPICGAAFLYKVYYLVDTKILFVESICRVKSLSLSGRILYYLADSVLVQWKELQDRYPRADFVGTLM